MDDFVAHNVLRTAKPHATKRPS